MKYCLITFLCLITVYATAKPIVIYTEEFPPFNYTVNGKLVGLSTEIVLGTMALTDLEYEVRVVPWSRAFGQAQLEPNALIFSITRLPIREDLFRWIGVISPSPQSVFTLRERDELQLTSVESLTQVGIGVAFNDARDMYLTEALNQPNNITRLTGEDAYLRLYKMLKIERIDVWPMPDLVAYHLLATLGENPKQSLRKQFELPINDTDYYLAANLSMPEQDVIKIKNALEQFKATAEYKQILFKWNGHDP